MPTTDTLTQVQSLLNDTRLEINELLQDKQHLLIFFNSKFDLMINRCSVLNGTGQPKTAEMATKFNPVKHFLGREIKPIKKVKNLEKELTPKQEEVNKFKGQVTALQTSFGKMTNDEILTKYKNNQLVIRGVASRAGIDDFKTAAIDSEFLDLIRNGLGEQAEFKKQQGRDDKLVAETDDEELS